MSGGVDSAVAALLLREQGHQVTGLMMTTWDGPPATANRCGSGACYGPGEEHAVADARAVCAVLGIALRVFDCARAYRDTVVALFRSESLAGRTPNPCVLCNPAMKFGLLPALAREAGLVFDAFATGHYARTRRDEASGRTLLLRAVDRSRDQSYFLHRLTQDQLASARFPLGALAKAEVRRLARDRGLPVSTKPDSQDFYDGDPRELLGVPDRTGPILDANGTVLGEHRGYWHFTIGQRKGLGLAAGTPRYVLALDAKRNAVIVGGASDLLAGGLTTRGFHAIVENLPARATVKIRSASPDVPCALHVGADGVTVRFDEPQAAVAPGQSAVFYDGDVVLGGGPIAEPLPP